MLHAVDISVAFDRLPAPLFQHLNLSVRSGDKIALIGPNGSGKSTLLNVLAQRFAPGEGRVVVLLGAKIAKLDQEPVEPDHYSLDSDTCFIKNLIQIGLSPEITRRRWTDLSSGERMRIAIAHALTSNPDILLLDEPTNHLDGLTKDWIFNFLASAHTGMVFATHDREFADRLATRTIELERGFHKLVHGGYSALEEQKRLTAKSASEEFESQQKEVRRLKNAAEKTVDRAGQMTRTPRNADAVGLSKPHFAALQKKLDRRAKAIRSRVQKTIQNEVAKPFEVDRQRLEFHCDPIRDTVAIEARNVAKGFGGRSILTNLSFDVGANDRLAVTGKNGCGKTTLLNLLADPSEADAGHVLFGRSIRIGYLRQEVAGFDDATTILRNLDPKNAEHETHFRILLGRLGLRGDRAQQPMSSLSMGERNRVAIVKILLSGANLLLLDEPTNHLDIRGLEVLEHALADFPGAVIFVSHDAAFVSRVATCRLELSGEVH